MGQMICKDSSYMILAEYQDNFCPVHQRRLRGEEKLASDGHLGQRYVRWWSGWGAEPHGRLLRQHLAEAEQTCSELGP